MRKHAKKILFIFFLNFHIHSNGLFVQVDMCHRYRSWQPPYFLISPVKLFVTSRKTDVVLWTTPWFLFSGSFSLGVLQWNISFSLDLSWNNCYEWLMCFVICIFWNICCIILTLNPEIMQWISLFEAQLCYCCWRTVNWCYLLFLLLCLLTVFLAYCQPQTVRSSSAHLALCIIRLSHMVFLMASRLFWAFRHTNKTSNIFLFDSSLI